MDMIISVMTANRWAREDEGIWIPHKASFFFGQHLQLRSLNRREVESGSAELEKEPSSTSGEEIETGGRSSTGGAHLGDQQAGSRRTV